MKKDYFELFEKLKKIFFNFNKENNKKKDTIENVTCMR